jgi:ribosomal-protein-alanine N-acetyltransferase
MLKKAFYLSDLIGYMMTIHSHSFTTKRLLIRPLVNEDKALYLSLYTDDKIMRNIGQPLTVAAAERAFFNALNALNKPFPKTLTWVIIDKENNKRIGIQALHRIDNNSQNAEIGIILSTLANGKSFPEEAIGALIEYGFTRLHLKQINAFFANQNLATARVSKKTGFVENRVHPKSKLKEKIESVYEVNWQRRYIKSYINKTVI